METKFYILDKDKKMKSLYNYFLFILYNQNKISISNKLFNFSGSIFSLGLKTIIRSQEKYFLDNEFLNKLKNFSIPLSAPELYVSYFKFLKMADISDYTILENINLDINSEYILFLRCFYNFFKIMESFGLKFDKEIIKNNIKYFNITSLITNDNSFLKQTDIPNFFKISSYANNIKNFYNNNKNILDYFFINPEIIINETVVEMEKVSTFINNIEKTNISFSSEQANLEEYFKEILNIPIENLVVNIYIQFLIRNEHYNVPNNIKLLKILILSREYMKMYLSSRDTYIENMKNMSNNDFFSNFRHKFIIVDNDDLNKVGSISTADFYSIIIKLLQQNKHENVDVWFIIILNLCLLRIYDIKLYYEEANINIWNEFSDICTLLDNVNILIRDMVITLLFSTESLKVKFIKNHNLKTSIEKIIDDDSIYKSENTLMIIKGD